MRTCLGIPATCYKTENAQIPESAGESAGKSAGKKGTAGGTAGSSAVSLLFQKNRPPSTAPSSPPSSPFFTGTLPSTLPGTFGDLGVLSPVAGRWDSKTCLDLLPWKTRRNPPQNRQQNSNQNLGALRPKSTMQGSCLDMLRNACGDSVTNLLGPCFCGVSHNYRAICCQVGYCKDVPV